MSTTRRSIGAAVGLALILPLGSGCSQSSIETVAQPAAPSNPPVAPTAAPGAVDDSALAAAAQQSAAGSKLLEQGDYQQAVEHFTMAIKSSNAAVQQPTGDAASAELYRKRGIAYLRMGFPDTAKDDFSDAIAFAPNNPAGYEQRAVAYMELGDRFNALRDATQAIRLNPHNAAAYHTRGLVYLKRGQYDRAVADLEQTLVEDPALAAIVTPKLGEAYYRWSRDLQDDGATTASEEKLARAEAIAPEFVYREQQAAKPEIVEVEVIEQTVAKPVVTEADEHYTRARELQVRGENDQAIIEFTASITLDPDQTEAYLHRGETLLAMGFPDTALEDFQTAAANGDTSNEVNRLQARAFLNLGSPNRAAMSATDALHSNPTDAGMYAIRGEAYLMMENWDRAITDLDEAVRRDPALKDSLAEFRSAAKEGRADAQARRNQTAYAQ
jgi:tetratricopeptide (TPR) repeat protein